MYLKIFLLGSSFGAVIIYLVLELVRCYSNA